MKKAVIILLLLCATASAAQSGVTVEGIVADEGSHAPVPGVHVNLTKPGWVVSTKTDRNGMYRFSEVPVGTYRLEACCDDIIDVQRVTKRLIVRDKLVHLDVPIRTYVRIEGQVVVPDWKPPFGIIEWYAAQVTATNVKDNTRTSGLLSPSATFTLLLLAGEQYRIEINNPSNYPISSMTFGSLDLLSNLIKLEHSSDDKIRIVLSKR
jgi:hypothetical protein